MWNKLCSKGEDERVLIADILEKTVHKNIDKIVHSLDENKLINYIHRIHIIL